MSKCPGSATHRATAVPRLGLPLMLCILVLASTGPALEECSGQDRAMSSERRAAIVRRVAAAVEEHYVFADMGKQTGDSLRSKLDAGGYDAITDSKELVTQLTADLQSISHDPHMKVYLFQRDPASGEPDSIARRAQELAELRRENFGFDNVDILPGNIGYVKIHQFCDPRHPLLRP